MTLYNPRGWASGPWSFTNPLLSTLYNVHKHFVKVQGWFYSIAWTVELLSTRINVPKQDEVTLKGYICTFVYCICTHTHTCMRIYICLSSLLGQVALVSSVHIRYMRGFHWRGAGGGSEGTHKCLLCTEIIVCNINLVLILLSFLSSWFTYKMTDPPDKQGLQQECNWIGDKPQNGRQMQSNVDERAFSCEQCSLNMDWSAF